MALPTNVGKGTVRGSFIDFAGNPIEGTVTLTAVPKRLTNATATPRPVTILPKPVTIPLVNGEFTRTDIIATDDPDNSPHDWTYRVSFNFAGGASADAFEIEVPEGVVTDLTTVTPVASSGGVQIIRGAGVPDTDGVDDGNVLVLVNGEPTWGPGGGGGAPAEHDHEIADVQGLQSALDAKQPAGSYSTTGHTHTIGQVSGLQGALDAKQPAGSYAAATHGHAISDVTGLQTELNKIPTEISTVAISDGTSTATGSMSGRRFTDAYVARKIEYKEDWVVKYTGSVWPALTTVPLAYRDSGLPIIWDSAGYVDAPQPPEMRNGDRWRELVED